MDRRSRTERPDPFPEAVRKALENPNFTGREHRIVREVAEAVRQCGGYVTRVVLNDSFLRIDVQDAQEPSSEKRPPNIVNVVNVVNVWGQTDYTRSAARRAANALSERWERRPNREGWYAWNPTWNTGGRTSVCISGYNGHDRP